MLIDPRSVQWDDPAPQPTVQTIPIPPSPRQQRSENRAERSENRAERADRRDANKDAVTIIKERQQIRQQPVSTEDAKVIDAMRQSASGIPETLNILNQAAGAVDRFNPGPARANAVDTSIPARGHGIMENARAKLMQIITGTSDQDIQDYQAILRAQNKGVLAEQQLQKGPQTESDAMRMAMTALSPDKSKNLNARVIGDTILTGLIAQKKPDFYNKWAIRNGSLNALENGRSVDEAWAEDVARVQNIYNNDPRIRRLNETVRNRGANNAPGRGGQSGGWKIERVGQ